MSADRALSMVSRSSVQTSTCNTQGGIKCACRLSIAGRGCAQVMCAGEDGGGVCPNWGETHLRISVRFPLSFAVLCRSICSLSATEYATRTCHLHAPSLRVTRAPPAEAHTLCRWESGLSQLTRPLYTREGSVLAANCRLVALPGRPLPQKPPSRRAGPEYPDPPRVCHSIARDASSDCVRAALPCCQQRKGGSLRVHAEEPVSLRLAVDTAPFMGFPYLTSSRQQLRGHPIMRQALSLSLPGRSHAGGPVIGDEAGTSGHCQRIRRPYGCEFSRNREKCARIRAYALGDMVGHARGYQLRALRRAVAVPGNFDAWRCGRSRAKCCGFPVRHAHIV
jgi:hypothetical protein